MWYTFGSARAYATLTNGVVTSVTVVNAGFGFTYAPLIEFLGGGNKLRNSTNLGLGQPGGQDAPSNTAQAHCVMTGSAPNMSVASIVVDNGGGPDVRAASAH